MAGLGHAVAFEMAVPFPLEDEPRAEAVGYLRDAQRRLRENDIDGAILKARQALEYIETNSAWSWPGRKDKQQRTQEERWAWIRAGLADQASGATHKDATTKNFHYSRAEAEVLISMTTALLRLVP
jgi:hypothetical protein